MITIIAAVAIALQAQPEPDAATLLPRIVEVVEARALEEGESREIAIDLASFVAGVNKVVPKARGASQLRAAMGRDFIDRKAPSNCKNEPAQCKIPNDALFLELIEMVKTEDGYAVVVLYERNMQERYGTYGAVMEYDFAWDGKDWVVRQERVVIQS